MVGKCTCSAMIYYSCILYLQMSLLVQEMNATVLELVAGCSVAAVMSGTTVYVKEQPMVMQRKIIMFLFVKTVTEIGYNFAK